MAPSAQSLPVYCMEKQWFDVMHCDGVWKCLV